MNEMKCECPARKALENLMSTWRREYADFFGDDNVIIAGFNDVPQLMAARTALSAPCPCEGLREESEGRRITLFEKADELAIQWRRAEQAEAERDQLRAELEQLKNVPTSR